jgi:drug/metabolite transporter (DMT)-like permease
LESVDIPASFASMASTSSRPGAPPEVSDEPPIARVLLAFAAIYFIWGSTFLAIRWAIDTMPPLGMASARFFVAGALMYGWARASGIPRPTARQWKDGAISGTLLLAGGNGAVVVAEQWVPSGLVALLVATVPLWLVVLDSAFGSRVRPTSRTVAGLLIGLVGVAVLVGSPGVGAGGGMELVGGAIVLCGSLSWAAGSLYSRYTVDPPRPRMQVGTQMLLGALVLGVLALVTGEADGFSIDAVSLRSWLALGYLITFGAIVGYGAYIWLLTVVEPARVGTYAYVNPVVAMLLGWTLADEPMGFRSVLAAAIILGSVVVITTEATWRPRSPARRESAVRGSP